MPGKEYGVLQDKFRKDKRLSPEERDRLNALRKQMDVAQAPVPRRDSNEKIAAFRSPILTIGRRSS
jgi:hypothetical protein